MQFSGAIYREETRVGDVEGTLRADFTGGRFVVTEGDEPIPGSYLLMLNASHTFAVNVFHVRLEPKEFEFLICLR